MILILTKKSEQCVSEVALWLNKYKVEYLRVNLEDTEIEKFVDKIEIINGDTKVYFNHKGHGFTDRKISCVWFRHAIIPKQLLVKLDLIKNEVIKSKVNHHLNDEYNSIIKSVFSLLSYKKNIGDFYAQQLNKIESINAAISLGIKCPDTLVTTKKSELKLFFHKHGKIISKGIQEVLMVLIEGILYNNYTELITEEQIEKLPDVFSPSLFQKYIEKKYELRIFYLYPIFYASAIFSQSNEKTKIDFRKYDLDYPNRVVPFKLPSEIGQKLKLLMDSFKITSASIDMIVNSKNEFNFLEINPVGQFGFISDSCNYYLGKKIAECLIENQKAWQSNENIYNQKK